MWNYFKKKKLRKEEARKLAEKKVAILRVELQEIEKKTENIARKERDREREKDKNKNTICPNCHGVKVNERIKRIEGSIDGNIHGSGSSFFFSGHSSMSGSVHGSLDTNEVNKCNNCGHEWKKVSTNYIYCDDIYKKMCRYVTYLSALKHDIEHCKYDPIDINEKYNSIEEKKEALTKDYNQSWYKETINGYWKDVSLEAFMELMKKHLSPYELERFMECYNEDVLRETLGIDTERYRNLLL